MIKRLENENYISYMMRVVGAVKNGEIGYVEMGDLLLGEENCYSVDNLRKSYYVLNKICEKVNEQPNNVKNRILCLSDFHVPFQLPIETFEKFRAVTDTLVLNGDLVDFNQISKFSKVCRNTPMDDLVETRQYLVDLIKYINPRDVYITIGNHEKRFEKYLDKNIGNDLINLMPKSPIDYIVCEGLPYYDHQNHSKVFYEPLKEVFPDKKFHYSGNWYCQVGNTIFAHPSAFSSGILKTAEKAAQFFRNERADFDLLVLSHTHRSGAYAMGGGSEIIEQGCCCDVVKNNYRDAMLVNEQKEGFVYICQDENGDSIRELTQRVVLN